jgi:predicted O-methyltransferase YrrM
MRGLTKLIKILSNILIKKNYKTRIYVSKNREMEKALENENIICINDIYKADIVICNIPETVDNIFIDTIESINYNTLLILLDTIEKININPKVVRIISDRDMCRAWLPINNGVTIFIRRRFDNVFLRETVMVYRDSFLLGPNPIHYNTAYTLYILSKFILSRARGTILEIGTGRGFSTIWLAQVAKETESQIVSIDNNISRVEYASKAMRELGLNKYVEIIYGDAKKLDIKGRRFSIVFIDGRKEEYYQYLEKIEKNLIDGAMIIAHNTISSSYDMPDYIHKVYNEPYESITIATDPAGITISLYKGERD